MTPYLVRLRNRRDQRVRAGHPWIFSNEIDGDVAALPPGGAVEVVDAQDRFIGRGYANPRSLISVRLLTADRDDVDDPAFYVERLRRAVERRRRALPGRTDLRLVHGEGDDLPGLVIDRYGDVVVVQIGSLGMEVRLPVLAEAIRQALAPRAAVLRSEGPARQLEGLPDVREPWFGEVPDEVEISEYGVRFVVSVGAGPKAGHFYDQSVNRMLAAPCCVGAEVLDVYANTGGFALHALVGGATRAVAVDRSEALGERMRLNAARNGVAHRLDVVIGDGRDVLRQFAADGRSFDVVMLDPPAFAKARKATGAALRAYRDVNALGAALVRPGGLLVTSSCSWHVLEERFDEAVVQGAADAGRRLCWVRRGEQAPDHVVRPEIPETRYLKHRVAVVEPR